MSRKNESVAGISKSVQAQLDTYLSRKKGPLRHPRECLICLEDLSWKVVKLTCEYVFFSLHSTVGSI